MKKKNPEKPSKENVISTRISSNVKRSWSPIFQKNWLLTFPNGTIYWSCVAWRPERPHSRALLLEGSCLLAGLCFSRNIQPSETREAVRLSASHWRFWLILLHLICNLLAWQAFLLVPSVSIWVGAFRSHHEGRKFSDTWIKLFGFWPHPWPAEVPGLGVETTPQQWPKLL